MGARFEEHIPEPQSEPMGVDPATEDTNEVIKNPFFYMAELSKDVFFSQASQSVTKLRCDVGLPETKIQVFHTMYGNAEPLPTVCNGHSQTFY